MITDIKILFFNFPSKDRCLEHNFILNEILPRYSNKIVKFIYPHDIDQTNETFDVFVYPCRHHKVWTYYGYPPVYEQVLDAVKKFKPKIIIQLYDECSYEYLNNHLELSKYCKLFLKEYSHPHQSYSDNTIHIPLGVPNTYEYDLSNIKMIKDRKYFWSWSGHVKQDRIDMINNFMLKVWKGNICTSTALTPLETSNLYRDSIFVPCGRGNYTLDCWRIYESIVSGAIPVVVGSLDELKYTFNYPEFPPFIHDETWNGATDKCVNLLKKYVKDDYEELDNIQNSLLEWWKKLMLYISTEVYTVLKDS